MRSSNTKAVTRSISCDAMAIRGVLGQQGVLGQMNVCLCNSERNEQYKPSILQRIIARSDWWNYSVPEENYDRWAAGEMVYPSRVAHNCKGNHAARAEVKTIYTFVTQISKARKNSWKQKKFSSQANNLWSLISTGYHST